MGFSLSLSLLPAILLRGSWLLPRWACCSAPHWTLEPLLDAHRSLAFLMLACKLEVSVLLRSQSLPEEASRERDRT